MNQKDIFYENSVIINEKVVLHRNLKTRKVEILDIDFSYSTIANAYGYSNATTGSIPNMSFRSFGCVSSGCPDAIWFSSLYIKRVAYMGWFSGCIDPGTGDNWTHSTWGFQRPALNGEYQKTK